MMLTDEVAAGAICDASLRDIAAGSEYFPAYAVLKTALETWHEGHLFRLSHAGAVPASGWMGDGIARQEAAAVAASAQAVLDWSDPGNVMASVRSLQTLDGVWCAMGLRLLRMAVGQFAPGNLDLVPDPREPIPVAFEAPEAVAIGHGLFS